ncbi:tetratricopeptide repeat protein [Cyclobacterium jeungdonense]|uniref:Tetratricopeptide repeat protein n=1 Tax=Cyclobacterium jeungdonense TaxID=708087 RepID=A0ABT8CDQ6_9BACT|nr:tetratricopeptide repeat protein [Cyclobacterium jeungdonense]MDN3690207.1 tetratricopeptide repeat protein [Cyclobacterium jeungdonense]
MVKTLETGITYYKEGKFEEALQVFDRLVNLEGPQAQYLHYRARIQSRLGALDQAINDFDALMELEPYNTTFISDRAVVLHLLKRNDEAMHAFDQALNLDPKNPYRYSSRAYFKDRIGDFQGAIADYERAIALDPEDAIAQNNKGMIEEKLGYLSASKRSFSVADELTGHSPAKPTEPNLENGTGPRAGSVPFQLEDSGKSNGLAHFFATLKKIVTDKETRNEFKTFILTKIKGS